MPRFSTAGRSLIGFMFVIALTVLAPTAHAAAINYGDFGPDFPPGATMYLDVTESSGTDATPLFYAPTITEDVLDFDPKGFVASGGSGASDLTDGQLNFAIMTLPGAGISSLMLGESGDFSLLGTGTAATLLSAGVSAHIEILEVDGIALATPITLFASSSVSFDLVNNAGVLSPWSNSLFVDLGAALTGNNISYQLGVTKANVVIDDLLVAISESQSTALIAKKNFTITPTIEGNPIPEPASLALFTLGAACVFRRSNR